MDNLFNFGSMRLNQKKRLLEKVDLAIEAILDGAQSYRIGTRSLTRANLNDLLALQKKLEDDIKAEEENGFLLSDTSVAYFDRR